MKWVLYVISMMWIIFGSFAILYTTRQRDMLKGLLENAHLKIIAIFPFTAGVLLLLASSASHYPWFIRLIAMLAIVKGAFIFSNPNRTADKLNNWYLNAASDQTCRLFGIIAILLGSAVFSWII